VVPVARRVRVKNREVQTKAKGLHAVSLIARRGIGGAALGSRTSLPREFAPAPIESSRAMMRPCDGDRRAVDILRESDLENGLLCFVLDEGRAMCALLVRRVDGCCGYVQVRRSH
jgi:hypothetical protein